MSVDLYLQGYSAAGKDGLPTSDVLKLFGVTAPPDEFGFFALRYDDLNWCDLHVVELDGKAVALSIGRPCNHRQLWEDILSLLTKGPYLAFMPGSPPVLVNAEVARHAPEDMIEALGAPVVVATGNALRIKLIE